MKLLLLGFLTLGSFAALAEDYSCRIQVFEGGELVGIMNVKQGVGMTVSNSLYTIPVSSRKNLIGKVVEEVNIVLSGTVMSDGTQEGSSIKAEIALETTTSRKQIKTLRKKISLIEGSGFVDVSGTQAGYTVDGICDTRF